ncbi:MAG: Fic family protein [Bacteroides sp.]|nr:Fic family protein [Bacteroides sp.]
MLMYPQEYIDDVLIRFAYNSNAIEGNTLTSGQTKAIILNETVTVTGIEGVKLRDVYEASNQKDAFYTMLNLANNMTPLSTDVVLNLHYELTKNTIPTAGKFKQNDNYIIGADFETSTVENVPLDIKQWVDNTNYRLKNSKDDTEFVNILMDSHIQFERIHPFDDGNGRTGRELINLELAKKGLPFLVIEEREKNQYITFEDNQDYVSLGKFAQIKMAQEKKRYQSFLTKLKKQKDYETGK